MPTDSPTHDVVALLQALVSCSSVNPLGTTPQAPPFGEGRLVALLADLLRGWGAEVSIREVAPGRPNLTANFAGANPARTLMLEAHSDTVQIDGMSIPPFGAEVRDGRLYGRGACDTKGAMAAMLMGIRRVLDEERTLPVSVVFSSTCDEEMGARGARQLMTDGVRPDLVVVGEPTDLAICHAHKGTLRWQIRTRGQAAHSSAPERGVNAIYLMNRVIGMLETDMSVALRRKSHPLLGPATISVGTIRGGTQVNVVPAECSIEMDRRLLPGETREAVTAELEAKLTELGRATPHFAYELESTQYYEPLEVATDAFPCRVAAAGCRRALGEARFVTAPWSSNGGIFAAAGVPTVLIGPGSILQAHTHDEFIELQELKRGVDVYAAIIRAAGAMTDWG